MKMPKSIKITEFQTQKEVESVLSKFNLVFKTQNSICYTSMTDAQEESIKGNFNLKF